MFKDKKTCQRPENLLVSLRIACLNVFENATETLENTSVSKEPKRNSMGIGKSLDASCCCQP